MDQPGRPLGVSLAIFMSVVWFSVLPLLQVGLILLVQQRFQHLDLSAAGVDPIAYGGDFLGVPTWILGVQSVSGVLFFFFAIFAWRGRPHWMRQALPVAVALLTVIILILTIQQATTQPDFQAGISSMNAISATILKGEFLGSLLVMLYVIWYMNRGPARAFYRGYYLSHPAQAAITKDADSG
jgi:hypothetical protein